MFNVSFSCGSSPTILKTRKVTPICKKDAKLNHSKYRPISLISNIDKVLESIVYNRLNKFFEDNKLIYNLQFGLRLKHSTSHALIYLTEKICEQLDSGKYGCGIFADFQKAFDTVDHAILTQKLNYYGVRGNAIGFLHILKAEHNSSILMILIQVLKKLTVVSPKVSIRVIVISYTSMISIILLNFAKLIILLMKQIS